jgi:hypothetical protein
MNSPCSKTIESALIRYFYKITISSKTLKIPLLKKKQQNNLDPNFIMIAYVRILQFLFIVAVLNIFFASILGNLIINILLM